MFKTLYGKIIWRNFMLISIATLVIGIISLGIMFRYGTERTFDNNTRVAVIVAKRIDNFVTFAAERTKTAGWLLSNVSVKDRSQYLPTIFKLTNVFDSVAIINKKGILETVYPHNDKIIGLNLSQRDYVKEVLAGKEFYSTEAFKALSGNLIVVFAAPIKDRQGRTEAVLSCTFNFKENRFFKNLFAQLENHYGGYGYMVDSRGKILIHPDNKTILKDVSNNPVVKEVIKGKTGHLSSVNSQGNRMLASFTPVTAIDWGIVVQDPLRAVVTPLKTFFWAMALILLLLIIFTLLVNHFIVKQMVKPINELKKGMLLAAQGNLAQQIAVAGEDEISFLAQSFNNMLKQLKTLREGEMENFEELKNAEKLAAIGELAAGTAHEIRNPLTAIKGFIQMLEKYDLSNEKRHDYLKIVGEEIKSIEKITGQFLTLAKSNPVEFKKINIKQVLEEVTSLLSHEAFINEITIVPTYNKVPEVFGSAGQLKQVFINLMKNAIEAMAEGGLLKVNLYFDSHQEKVVTQIQDQGTGIAPEVLKKIGQPFISTKDKGTGLGLTVSYRIIQNHLGFIDLDSGSKGTTFFISLPALKNEIKN